MTGNAPKLSFETSIAAVSPKICFFGAQESPPLPGPVREAEMGSPSWPSAEEVEGYHPLAGHFFGVILNPSYLHPLQLYSAPPFMIFPHCLFLLPLSVCIPGQLYRVRKITSMMAGRDESDVKVAVSPYRICPLGAHIDHQVRKFRLMSHSVPQSAMGFLQLALISF